MAISGSAGWFGGCFLERVGRWFQELVYLCLQNLKLTVMMRLLTFFLCCWISSSVWAADRVVCVTRDRAEAPQGAVIASTLQKGIVLAGKYKQKGDDVTLLVAGGTYRLDKTLEMTARELGLTAGSLVVRPLDGAKVIFYGGVEIPAQYIEQAPASESRIRPEMRGKIVKVDLRKAGITSLGALRPARSRVTVKWIIGAVHSGISATGLRNGRAGIRNGLRVISHGAMPTTWCV